MKSTDIIRAWKDEQYYNSLSAEERAALPANPAGELSAVEAEQIAGGSTPTSTWPACAPMSTWFTGGNGCDECDEK